MEMLLPWEKEPQNKELPGPESLPWSAGSDGHLEECVDEEKIQEEKADIRPNPRFDRGNDETDKTMEEEDLSMGTIHMIGGPNHADLENTIQEEIRMIKQMSEVLSVQSMTKKSRQKVSKSGSITLTKVDFEKV